MIGKKLARLGKKEQQVLAPVLNSTEAKTISQQEVSDFNEKDQR
jgi:hypothetical protein